MKKLYYILNFTWGIIMNIFGLIGAGAMLVLGKKPIRHAGSIVFRTGHNWGGVSLGIFSFICEEAGEHTLNHEFGHSIQNAIYGPAFPIIVAIPSFVRYHKLQNKLQVFVQVLKLFFDFLQLFAKKSIQYNVPQP